MHSPPVEKWRPIPGFPHYEASDQGRIRSLPRTLLRSGGHTRKVPGGILTQSFASNYPKVGVTDGEGVKRTRNVHTLVAAAFLGPRPTRMDVCHNNGDRLDNRAANLRYDTRSENNLDIKRHGGRPPRTHCSAGHALSGSNLLMYGSPGTPGYRRRCKVCEMARQQARSKRTA